MASPQSLFSKDHRQHKQPLEELPEAPPWRDFRQGKSPEGQSTQEVRGERYAPTEEDALAINAALLLRRPLLVTGDPGSGKSTLAYAIAWQFNLGQVLHWPINSRTRLQEGLYGYDAIGRLHQANLKKKESPAIEDFLKLGPLGSALASPRPKVLLVDELDKGDIDLPNDLLHILEEGFFEIPEIKREKRARSIRVDSEIEDDTIKIAADGRVSCHDFPIVVITSNNERTFPAPFLRRCIRHKLEKPDDKRLFEMVKKHFRRLTGNQKKEARALIKAFIEKRDDRKQSLANDQLLNAVFILIAAEHGLDQRDELRSLLLADLKAPK